MYCVTVLCCRQIYSSIVWNPASYLAATAAAKVYSHFPSVLFCGICPISCRFTWSWNPPRDIPMRGMTKQVSDPKSNTACTTALKKNPDTHGSDPSLMRILVILFHTSLASEKLLNTASQLSSAANITCPRYQKEVTISRVRP